MVLYIQSLYLEKKNKKKKENKEKTQEEGEEELEIKKIELMGSGSGASTTARHTHGHTRLDNTDPRGAAPPGNGKLCMALWDPWGGQRAAPLCLPWHIPESRPAPRQRHRGA